MVRFVEVTYSNGSHNFVNLDIVREIYPSAHTNGSVIVTDKFTHEVNETYEEMKTQILYPPVVYDIVKNNDNV